MRTELRETTEHRECATSEITGPPKPFVPSARSFAGWILYDGGCGSCTAFAKHFDRTFRRRGFRFLPLRTMRMMKRLRLDDDARPQEMHVLTRDGRDLAGAQAVIFLARQVWWTLPLVLLGRLPGAHKLLARAYRWIAAHRGSGYNEAITKTGNQTLFVIFAILIFFRGKAAL